MREHTAALSPPRALWVPFMLGRPLGAPADAAFQRRVIVAALELFNRSEGPVLADFPDDAPELAASEADAPACPVGFAHGAPRASLSDRVQAEIAGLRTWHDLAVRSRGRTAVGVAGAPLETLVEFIASWIDRVPRPAYGAGLTDADALRIACEEIKTYYFEALAAQPGAHTSDTLRRWFWEQTAAGALILALRPVLARSADKALAKFGRENLVPRAVWHAARRS